MTLKYWEDQAKKELTLPASAKSVPEIAKPDVKTEIIDLNEAKTDIEIKRQNDREVDEYFENEEQNYKPKSVGRMIFVDGLFGVPFLLIMDILITVLVILTGIVSIALAGGTLAVFAGSVYTMIHAFGNIISNTGDSVVIIGCCIAGLGICGLLLMATSFFMLKAIPFVSGLYRKFFRKLGLF